MAINQNHLFEELNGVKCAVVEKNVAPARVDFLRKILEYNGFTVVVVSSPPPKAAAGAVAAGGASAAGKGATAPAGIAAGAASTVGAKTAGSPAGVPGAASTTGNVEGVGMAGAGTASASAPPPPETFTIGVTDVMFNPINAIFGRLLKAPGGHVVTLAFWQQRESAPDDERPYFS